MTDKNKSLLARRFRGFFPVIVDVETGGFNHETDALLELAAVTIKINDRGICAPAESCHFHIKPFEGANLDEAALAFTGIRPFHPLRLAVDESEALNELFAFVRAEKKEVGCPRAVLVGQNACFDLNFLNAAVTRTKIKRNPFHAFTVFDTASLAALAYGQTTLPRALEAAHIPYDSNEAHSAKYDAKVTAELFCTIVNRWHALGGWPPSGAASHEPEK